MMDLQTSLMLSPTSEQEFPWGTVDSQSAQHGRFCPTPSSDESQSSFLETLEGDKEDKKKTSTYKHVPHREKPPHLVARRNARERRRVQAVNGVFAKLRKCVPIENRSKRLSRVKTLHKAIEYIAALQRLLEDADAADCDKMNNNNINNNNNDRANNNNTPTTTPTATTTTPTATTTTTTTTNINNRESSRNRSKIQANNNCNSNPNNNSSINNNNTNNNSSNHNNTSNNNSNSTDNSCTRHLLDISNVVMHNSSAVSCAASSPTTAAATTVGSANTSFEQIGEVSSTSSITYDAKRDLRQDVHVSPVVVVPDGPVGLGGWDTPLPTTNLEHQYAPQSASCHDYAYVQYPYSMAALGMPAAFQHEPPTMPYQCAPLGYATSYQTHTSSKLSPHSC